MWRAVGLETKNGVKKPWSGLVLTDSIWKGIARDTGVAESFNDGSWQGRGLVATWRKLPEESFLFNMEVSWEVVAVQEMAVIENVANEPWTNGFRAERQGRHIGSLDGREEWFLVACNDESYYDIGVVLHKRALEGAEVDVLIVQKWVCSVMLTKGG